MSHPYHMMQSGKHTVFVYLCGRYSCVQETTKQQNMETVRPLGFDQINQLIKDVTVSFLFDGWQNLSHQSSQKQILTRVSYLVSI